VVSITTIPFPKASVQQAFKILCSLLGSILPKLRAPSTLYKYLFFTRPLNPGHKHSNSRAGNHGSLLNRSFVLSNITQAEPAPLSPLEALPTEIKLEILRRIPNTTALRALTDASRFYHQAYVLDCQKIFVKVLTRELETHGLTTEGMSFFELDTTQPSRPQLTLFHQRVRDLIPQLITKERSLALPILRSSTDSSLGFDVGVSSVSPGLPDVLLSEESRRSIQFQIMITFLHQTGEWKSWAPRGTFKAIVITLECNVDWRNEGSTECAHTSLQLHWKKNLKRPGCLTYILLQPYKALDSPFVWQPGQW